MILKDWTFNGTRYMIEGLITKVGGDGEKYHPEEAYNPILTEDIDEYRVECNTEDQGKDADGYYLSDDYGCHWAEVGDWYYDSIHDAIEAASNHAKETKA
jgi:hypothetical protein